MKNKKLGIFVLVLILLGLGGYFWNQKSSVPSTGISGTDLKLCSNKKYGYEVNYPSSWKVIYPGSEAEGGESLTTCKEGLSSIIISQEINWLFSPSIKITAMNQDDLKRDVVFCSSGCSTAEDYLAKYKGWMVNMGRLPDSQIDDEKLIWTAFNREVIFQGKQFKLDEFDLTNLQLYTSHKFIIYKFDIRNLSGTEELENFLSTFRFTN